MLKISVVLLLVVIVAVGGRARVGRARRCLDVDSEEAKKVADNAAFAFSEKLPGHFHHKLVKISMVNKYNVIKKYKVLLIVGLTTCKKQEVTYEEAKQCDIQEGAGAYKKCFVGLPQEKQREIETLACRIISKSDI